jgi:hypothetical protein
MKDLELIIRRVAAERPDHVWIPGLAGLKRKHRKLNAYALPELRALGYKEVAGKFSGGGAVLFRQPDERDGNKVLVRCDLGVVQEINGVLTAMNAPFSGYILDDSSETRLLLEPVGPSDTNLLRPTQPIGTASSLVIDKTMGTGLLVFLSHPDGGMNPSFKYWYTTSDTWWPNGKAEPANWSRYSSKEHDVRHVASFIEKALTTPQRSEHNFDTAIKTIAAVHNFLPDLRTGN